MNKAAAEKAVDLVTIIKIIEQEINMYEIKYKGNKVVYKPNQLASWIANRLLQEGMLK